MTQVDELIEQAKKFLESAEKFKANPDADIDFAYNEVFKETATLFAAHWFHETDGYDVMLQLFK